MPRAKQTKVSTKTVRPVVAGKVAHAPVATATAVAITDDAIALRAYTLYESEGRPEGRHLEHWLRAESELRG